MQIWTTVFIISALATQFNHTNIYEHIANITITTNHTKLSFPIHPTQQMYRANYTNNSTVLCLQVPQPNNYYPDQCAQMGNSTIWVTHYNKYVQNALNTPAPPESISGIVISYEDSFEIDLKDKSIGFIYRIEKKDLVSLLSYYKPGEKLSASIEYSYTFNCGLYKLDLLACFGSGSLILLCTLVWACLNNYCYVEQCQIIHKIICFLPFFKLLYWVMQSTIMYTCPWEGSMERVRPYLDMLSTSVSTIFDTFMVAVIYMLSIGYSLVRTELMKDSMNAIIFYMGIIYILESINFIATTQNHLKYTISSLELTFYVFFLYKLVTNLYFNVRVLSLYSEAIKREDNTQTTRRYIREKKYMLIEFALVSSVYLTCYIFRYMAIFIVKTDTLNLTIAAISNAVDALYIICIMLVIY